MSNDDASIKKKDEGIEEKTLRSKHYQWYIVIFMGLVGFLDNNLNLMEGQVIPDIIVHYGLPSEGYFALWQGIFGIVTFSVFILSWFTDAFGRKKGILVLILLMGVPAFLIPFLAVNIWIFYTLYAILITGTISNIWEIPVSEESPAKKRATYGGIATLISLIPLYAIIGDDIASALGWQWSYGIFFFVMLGLLVLLYFMKEPQRWTNVKEDRGHEFLKIKKAFKSFDRKDWTYALMSFVVYGIWAIGLKVGNAWGRHFYENVRTVYVPQIEWDTIILVAGLMILLGAILSGIIMDRVSRKVTLIVSCLGSVLGFVLLGVTGSPIAMWIAYLSMAIVFTWIMVYFTEVFRTEIRTIGMGIAALGSRLSYVLGPLLAAVMLNAFPDMVMFWVIPGLLMIIPLFILFLKPYETKGKTLEEIQEER
ncbi:MAG: MFS transporter [Candidatus Kariarchaeaceae archaeon]|jgi:MFS family permease